MDPKLTNIWLEAPKIFNTPLEISLRILFILSRFHPANLNADKLVYFDYFVIHSGDVDKKQKSIHPKYPFRSSEVIIKRELINKALRILLAKELLEVLFLPEGIYYQSSAIGNKVVEYFSSPYSKEIMSRCDWIQNTFIDYSNEQLSEIINTNIEKWGSEFTNESKFRGF